MDIQKVSLDELRLYPNNPRNGNIDIIAESLKAYGQYKPITVNKRNNEILAGNHTYRAAQKLGWEDIAVTYVDVDDETAMKIVLIDNKTSDSGSYQNDTLLELLDSLESLEATGYTKSDYVDLLDLLDKPDNGMTNVTMGGSLTDYAEKYAERVTRIIMMDYDRNTYDWLNEKLEQFRGANSLGNNSEALLLLLEGARGTTAPSKAGNE